MSGPVESGYRDHVPAPEPLLARDGTPARDLWGMDPGRIHLNHGSYGGSPLLARRLRAELLHELEVNPLAFYAALPARMADAREAVAPFVGARADEVAFVPNASAGTTLLLRALPIAAGQEILLTDHAYGALAMSAADRAEQAGARIRVVEVPLAATADDVVALLDAAIGERTAAVVLDQLTSPTARWMPVAEMAHLTADRGVPLIVDGAHAPGVVPAAAAGPGGDAWTGNLHKFASGQRGTAVLVARTPWARDGLRPLIDSWGARLPYPERFDHQGTMDATPYLATAAAIPATEELFGWDRIRDHVVAMLDYGQQVVGDALGADSAVEVGMPASTMRLLRIPGTTIDDPVAVGDVTRRLADEADFESVLIRWGGDTFVRLSAHAYSVAADFDAFADRAVPLLRAWLRP